MKYFILFVSLLVFLKNSYVSATAVSNKLTEEEKKDLKRQYKFISLGKSPFVYSALDSKLIVELFEFKGDLMDRDDFLENLIKVEKERLKAYGITFEEKAPGDKANRLAYVKELLGRVKFSPKGYKTFNFEESAVNAALTGGGALLPHDKIILIDQKVLEVIFEKIVNYVEMKESKIDVIKSNAEKYKNDPFNLVKLMKDIVDKSRQNHINDAKGKLFPLLEQMKNLLLVIQGKPLKATTTPPPTVNAKLTECNTLIKKIEDDLAKLPSFTKAKEVQEIDAKVKALNGSTDKNDAVLGGLKDEEKKLNDFVQAEYKKVVAVIEPILEHFNDIKDRKGFEMTKKALEPNVKGFLALKKTPTCDNLEKMLEIKPIVETRKETILDALKARGLEILDNVKPPPPATALNTADLKTLNDAKTKFTTSTSIAEINKAYTDAKTLGQKYPSTGASPPDSNLVKFNNLCDTIENELKAIKSSISELKEKTKFGISEGGLENQLKTLKGLTEDKKKDLNEFKKLEALHKEVKQLQDEVKVAPKATATPPLDEAKKIVNTLNAEIKKIVDSKVDTLTKEKEIKEVKDKIAEISDKLSRKTAVTDVDVKELQAKKAILDQVMNDLKIPSSPAHDTKTHTIVTDTKLVDDVRVAIVQADSLKPHPDQVKEIEAKKKIVQPLEEKVKKSELLNAQDRKNLTVALNELNGLITKLQKPDEKKDDKKNTIDDTKSQGSGSGSGSGQSSSQTQPSGTSGSSGSGSDGSAPLNPLQNPPSGTSGSSGSSSSEQLSSQEQPLVSGGGDSGHGSSIDQSQPATEKKSGWSTGAIIGIVALILVVVGGVIGVVVYFTIIRKKTPTTMEGMSTSGKGAAVTV